MSPDPGRRVDYDAAGEQYDRTRGRTTATEAYGDAVRRELADAPTGPVLDLGSGTGAWSGSLGRWSGRDVVAVEPSSGMRGVAAANRRQDGSPASPHQPSIHLVGGRAAGLPLREGVATAAWLSTVIHHVGDLGVCAAELRRVLRPGAPVLIRNAFAGRYDGIPSVRFFPPVRRALDRFPSVDAVRTAFGSAGFGFVSIERVDDPPVSYETWRERLPRQRTVDTAFVGLTDEEFDAGLRAIDGAIAAGRDPEPVGLDLLILR